MRHPFQDIVGSDGKELAGKRVVLGVTGSVSAYRAPDIARGLMRHGADVHVVMTASAQKIIHPYAMEWATGNAVVTELTGKIEHVMFTTGEEKADVVLVAPATANTIGKIASGIDDTPVTSYVSSALGGGIPILVAPAMHETMLTHPLIRKNLAKLEGAGVTIIAPTMEEGKAKLANPQELVRSVISLFSARDMDGLRVLVTGGATLERIDPVRVLTNRSSGKMAVALASAAKKRGAKVTLVYGAATVEPPPGVGVIRVESAQEMRKEVMSELRRTKYQLMVAAAAVSDYRSRTVSASKIGSKSAKLRIELVRTPKIIDEVKKVSPSTSLVIFKAEHSLPMPEMVRRAHERLREADADLVVLNDVGKQGVGFGTDENEVTVIDARGKRSFVAKAPKGVVADRILSLAIAELRRR